MSDDPTIEEPAPGTAPDPGSGEEALPDLGYRVAVENFSGPLDLLLYLVRRTELDIVDIPLELIIDQFVETVRQWQDLDLDIAGDFILMAATLLEIKARTIAPPPEGAATEVDEGEEFDPRASLIASLLAYRRFKEATQLLAEREADQALRCVRQLAEIIPQDPDDEAGIELGALDVHQLMSTFEGIMARINGLGPRTVVFDDVPMVARIERLVEALRERRTLMMSELLGPAPQRLLHVTTVMAVLECARQRLLEVGQPEQYGDISLRLRDAEENSGEPVLPPPEAEPPRRRKRLPLVTYHAAPGADDAPATEHADEDEIQETDEQRFLRELQENTGVDALIARAADLEASFAAFWAERHPELAAAAAAAAATAAALAAEASAQLTAQATAAASTAPPAKPPRSRPRPAPVADHTVVTEPAVATDHAVAAEPTVVTEPPPAAPAAEIEPSSEAVVSVAPSIAESPAGPPPVAAAPGMTAPDAELLPDAQPTPAPTALEAAASTPVEPIAAAPAPPLAVPEPEAEARTELEPEPVAQPIVTEPAPAAHPIIADPPSAVPVIAAAMAAEPPDASDPHPASTPPVNEAEPPSVEAAARAPGIAETDLPAPELVADASDATSTDETAEADGERPDRLTDLASRLDDAPVEEVLSDDVEAVNAALQGDDSARHRHLPEEPVDEQADAPETDVDDELDDDPAHVNAILLAEERRRAAANEERAAAEAEHVATNEAPAGEHRTEDAPEPATIAADRTDQAPATTVAAAATAVEAERAAVIEQPAGRIEPTSAPEPATAGAEQPGDAPASTIDTAAPVTSEPPPAQIPSRETVLAGAPAEADRVAIVPTAFDVLADAQDGKAEHDETVPQRASAPTGETSAATAPTASLTEQAHAVDAPAPTPVAEPAVARETPAPIQATEVETPVAAAAPASPIPATADDTTSAKPAAAAPADTEPAREPVAQLMAPSVADDAAPITPTAPEPANTIADNAVPLARPVMPGASVAPLPVPEAPPDPDPLPDDPAPPPDPSPASAPTRSHPSTPPAPLHLEPRPTPTPHRTPTPMSSSTRTWLIAALVAFNAAWLAYAWWTWVPKDVVEVVAAPPAELDLRAPLSWTFNLDMVAEQELTKPPVVVPALTPEQPGAWSWRDRRTLQFTPTRPLPYATAFTVHLAKEALRSMSGFRLHRDLDAALRTLPLAVDGAHVETFAADGHAVVALDFNQPVDPNAIAKALRIDAPAGAAVAAPDPTSVQGAATAQKPAFTIAGVASAPSASIRVTVAAGTPRDLGAVVLRLPRGTVGAGGPLGLAEDWTSNLDLGHVLTVTAASASAPSHGDVTIHLAVSATQAPRDLLVGAVTVTPTVPFTTAIAGDGIDLVGAFAPGADYHVAIAARWPETGAAPAHPLAAYPAAGEFTVPIPVRRAGMWLDPLRIRDGVLQVSSTAIGAATAELFATDAAAGDMPLASQDLAWSPRADDGTRTAALATGALLAGRPAGRYRLRLRSGDAEVPATIETMIEVREVAVRPRALVRGTAAWLAASLDGHAHDDVAVRAVAVATP